MPRKYPLRYYKKVIKEENEAIAQRRQNLFGPEACESLDETRFGIALSGGGIRSATINLGFLKTLNLFGILKKADYLSTVSGGGYTGAYVQATLKNLGSYEELFKQEHLEHLRSRGEYLTPEKGWKKTWNRLVLIITYLASLLMSWISPVILGFMGVGIYYIIASLISFDATIYTPLLAGLFRYGMITIISIFTLHFISNIFFNYQLSTSAFFNRVKTFLLSIGALLAIGMILFSFAGFSFTEITEPNLVRYIGGTLVLILLGFLSNPNALSMHRFYRKQVSDAFLNHAGKYSNVKLGALFNVHSENEADYLAPYPLINTCLNLQAENDDGFMGNKASDYFLLSPKYCGSKLVRYVDTAASPDYKDMTLPTAVTISAAAVNPGMGIYSNKLLGILTTVFNLRLGYWTRNPLLINFTGLKEWVWWPWYFTRELLSNLGTTSNMLNISDGGHIENLGVYELLRRKCRLIIAVDAGADPEFGFQDLENLVVRARNELGIALNFRYEYIPEETIRPKPSFGYSERRYAIADIVQIWEEIQVKNEKTGKREKVVVYPNKKIGTFVYVKSSVKAPTGKPDIDKEKEDKEYSSYKYKIYHPEFPHEPTSDQFFDEVQWEAYFQLGQFLAADVIGQKDLKSCYKNSDYQPDLSIEQLIRYFDDDETIFQEVAEYVDESIPSTEEEIVIQNYDKQKKLTKDDVAPIIKEKKFEI